MQSFEQVLAEIGVKLKHTERLEQKLEVVRGYMDICRANLEDLTIAMDAIIDELKDDQEEQDDDPEGWEEQEEDPEVEQENLIEEEPAEEMDKESASTPAATEEEAEMKKDNEEQLITEQDDSQVERTYSKKPYPVGSPEAKAVIAKVKRQLKQEEEENKKKTHTAKKKAIELLRKGLTVKEVMIKTGINKSNVYRWKKELDAENGDPEL